MGLNTVDIFMAVVIATVIFIGGKEGIVAGLFKLFGILCVVFVTLHYYVHLADFLRDRIFGEKISTEFFSFSVLGLVPGGLFFAVANGWGEILKLKLFKTLDLWGGVVLALVRSYFICSLLFVALVLSGSSYAAPRAMTSVSRALFGYGALGFYERAYGSLIAKFFPGEAINGHPFMIVDQEAEKLDKQKKR